MKKWIWLILFLSPLACITPVPAQSAVPQSVPVVITQPAPTHSSPPPALDTASPQPYALGISVEANSYSSRAFANIFKIDARVWVPNTMTLGPVDQNGMPSTDFDLFALDGAFLLNTAGFNGSYTLFFNGQAQVSAAGGTIENQQYDPAQNLTTARLAVSDPYPTIIFYFRSTRRTAASALNSGVTGLKLMRPMSVGSSQSYPPDAVFTSEFIALHNRGSVLRLMDFSATNGNLQHEWAERSTPADLTFFGETPGYGWQGKGAPWEYGILLANTLDQDIWINIPIYASDDYITQLADLLANTLEPKRKIYLEYSNELWNFGFAQWTQINGLVDVDLSANPQSSINFDGKSKPVAGTTDYGIAVPRYWARRIMQISDLFRARFGDAAMLARVRPVFETQAAWQHWISTGLIFLDRYYNNGDGSPHSPNPRPVNTYLWGGGGSGYLHGFPDEIVNNPNATVDAIFDGYAQAWEIHYQTMAHDTDWVAAFGLKRVAYEGGTGLSDFAAPDSALQQAQIDPRIEAVYRKTVDLFFQAGGDLFVTFLGTNLPHGLVPFDAIIGSQPTPKRNAFDAMLAAAYRPAPTVGDAIPTVIPGGRYHIREDGWSSGETDSPVTLADPYAWVSYTLHSTFPGIYTLTLKTTNSSAGQATVWLDGTSLLSGLDCPDGGPTQAMLVNLLPGVHAIRVQRNAGSFDLVSLTIDNPQLSHVFLPVALHAASTR